MKKIFLSFITLGFVASVFAQNITLPASVRKGGKPLMEVLNKRQSHREFISKDMDMQTLSNLLWATNGFNRSDKRVVPTSQNKQEIELYVVLKTGVYLYDAKGNILIEKIKGDHRKSVGKQDFVYDAPVNFIIVGDLNKSDKMSATIDAGFLVQNAYLFCASEGNLGTVVRGYFDKEEVRKLLNLSDKYEIVITQTIGYIK
jgi:nitroreductase